MIEALVTTSEKKRKKTYFSHFCPFTQNFPFFAHTLGYCPPHRGSLFLLRKNVNTQQKVRFNIKKDKKSKIKVFLTNFDFFVKNHTFQTNSTQI